MLQISRNSWHYRFMQWQPFVSVKPDWQLNDLCTYSREFFRILIVNMLMVFIGIPVLAILAVVSSILQLCLGMPIYFLFRLLLTGKIAIPNFWHLAIFKPFTDKCEFWERDELAGFSRLCLFQYDKVYELDKYGWNTNKYKIEGDLNLDINLPFNGYKLPPILYMGICSIMSLIAIQFTPTYWLAFFGAIGLVLLLASLFFFYSKFKVNINSELSEKAHTVFSKLAEAKRNTICPLVKIVDEVEDEQD